MRLRECCSVVQRLLGEDFVDIGESHLPPDIASLEVCWHVLRP